MRNGAQVPRPERLKRTTLGVTPPSLTVSTPPHTYSTHSLASPARVCPMQHTPHALGVLRSS